MCLLVLAGLRTTGLASWHASVSLEWQAHACCRRQAVSTEDENPVTRPVAFVFGASSSWERFTVRLQADTSELQMPLTGLLPTAGLCEHTCTSALIVALAGHSAQLACINLHCSWPGLVRSMPLD